MKTPFLALCGLFPIEELRLLTAKTLSCVLPTIFCARPAQLCAVQRLT